ncbi:MAG: peptidylprolyl isomerase [Acidobacteriota bacterium]|nr:peptidylprolyl isomerase [Acidobacteriota bacterium]
MPRSRILVPFAALALLSLAACATPSQPKSEASAAQPAPQAATPAPPVEKIGDATAIIETTAGKLTCKLFGNQTPKTVANFVGLAEGTREWTNPASHAKKHGVSLYEGTIFHRVIPNFMIQGGDPLGNGSGDPGYSFEDEFVPALRFDRPGLLAMANSGPDTNGSQFFITEVPTPHLTGHHTIFGQCDAATVALVRKITRMPRDERTDRPFKPVKITKITVVRQGEKSAAASAKAAAKPAAKPSK